MNIKNEIQKEFLEMRTWKDFYLNFVLISPSPLSMMIEAQKVMKHFSKLLNLKINHAQMKNDPFYINKQGKHEVFIFSNAKHYNLFLREEPNKAVIRYATENYKAAGKNVPVRYQLTDLSNVVRSFKSNESEILKSILQKKKEKNELVIPLRLSDDHQMMKNFATKALCTNQVFDDEKYIEIETECASVTETRAEYVIEKVEELLKFT
jgi:hypothetical protein